MELVISCHLFKVESNKSPPDRFVWALYLRLKEINLRCVLLFCYIIEPLNLSGLIMNLIEDFHILQFYWNLNFLLRYKEVVPQLFS